MKNFTLPILDNPLRTKTDLQTAFEQMTIPLIPHYSTGGAYLHVGNSSAGYGDHIAGIEGFSRILWGLAPHGAGGGDSSLWDVVLRGIANGTDPSHEEYWGNIQDYDQRIVEMAAMGMALLLVPEKIWEPLNEQGKKNFAEWLKQINYNKAYDCNWLLFAVIVNLGLKNAGEDWDCNKVEEALLAIEKFYISNGWYADGLGGHSDYYVSFAIHYYCLVYAKAMEAEDPVRSKLYKDRASEFAVEFIHWFAKDGSALPYGRSLTYRFAQCSFWGAFVYAGVEGLSIGAVKGILLRNLRWWLEQPIFDAKGILTIGYAYPNLILAENYNSPGSPYWGFKAFLPLCLADSHPFWTCEEEMLPALPEICLQREPHLVICRDKKNGDIMAFNTGHGSTNEHTHTVSKYEKFVYSNYFGFSVPRAEWGLSQGAFDSMLALCEEDNLYRVKRYAGSFEIHRDHLVICWQPWRDVSIRTIIVFGNPLHYRIHLIQTERPLMTAEGGFALALEGNGSSETEHEGFSFGCVNCSMKDKGTGTNSGIAVKSPFGSSAVLNLYGERNPEMIFPNANTNLISSRTIIPTLTGRLEPGRHCLVSAVYGSRNREGAECMREESLRVELVDDSLKILKWNEVVFSMMLEQKK